MRRFTWLDDARLYGYILAEILILWILVAAAIAVTVGVYTYAVKSNPHKVDCTTHNINPDAAKEQRELCRSAK